MVTHLVTRAWHQVVKLVTMPGMEIIFGKSVQSALNNHSPIVALESTIITHGLPYPQNLEMALSVEQTIREEKATPATIAIMNGNIHVGLTENELKQLAQTTHCHKASMHDIALCVAQKQTAGTTVAGTMCIAAKAGIHVFATGGIGGVHFGESLDVSTDLTALAKYPVAVISAGPKAILDIPKTLEYLETLGVPILTYQSDHFPAFYSRQTPWPAINRVESPLEIAQITKQHFDFHKHSGLLIVNPIGTKHEIVFEQIEPVIQKALQEATKQNIQGKAITPFLLAQLNELTEGQSVQANLALIESNARLAAQIAMHS